MIIKYAKIAKKSIERMDKSTKDRVKEAIERRFVPVDIDDIATPDDIAAHELAMREYEAGELISHEDIDWS